MLRTRLWVGSILAALGLAILIADEFLAPWHPGWYVLLLVLGLVACRELVGLIRQNHSVPETLCYVGVALLLSANWIAPVALHLGLAPWEFPATVAAPRGGSLPFPGAELVAWSCLAFVFVLFFLAVFVVEMANFKRPSGALVRMALVLWAAAYLGLLPSFLAQLRWLPGQDHQSTLALVMTIFVPKCCDIGAFFTGRWFGRHRMTPMLSPKKTWEGAVGGLALAVLVTIGLDRLVPGHVLHQTLWAEVGFGVTVGGAGIMGDLGESLIKRESQQKDASQVLPGFGGALDVIDAVLFAAPVAYLWLVFIGPSIQNWSSNVR